MAYRPVMGFLAHSLILSFFSLSCICRCSFAIVVISVIGSSSVASFASSSALSFPSIPICPGTHVTSIFAPPFSSRNVVAVSTNFCDNSWLGPGFPFVIALAADMLSANSMIVGYPLLVSGVFCWKAIVASSPLSNASISASYTSADLPIPSFPLPLSSPFRYTTHPAPVHFSCSLSFIDPSVYVIMYSFSCEICVILVQCSSAASPFVRPLRAGCG
jgi:hypothetical protein